MKHKKDSKGESCWVKGKALILLLKIQEHLKPLLCFARNCLAVESSLFMPVTILVPFAISSHPC